jgi:hypothetical protein
VDIEEIKRRIAELKNLPPDYFLAEQDQAARRLGFESYEHYRKSPRWRVSGNAFFCVTAGSASVAGLGGH